MDQNSQNSTNQQPDQNSQAPVGEVQQSPKDAFQQDIMGVKTIVAKVKQGIKEKRDLAKKTAQDQAQAGGTNPKPGLQGFFATNKKIGLLIGVLLLLVLLVVAGSLYQVVKRGKKPLSQTVTPTPVAVEMATPSAITNPSKYATDSGVLEIESMINNLDSAMGKADIRESQLTPPILDFEVKF